uniref:VIT domain-containing protein n=1 Tax=Chelonoidis abingdonii TaxID=106734 RepID=A0A8C0GFR5_CHEAB
MLSLPPLFWPVADIPLPPVPLRSSSVSVLIRGFVADVGCELLYRREEPGPMEAVFKFPVDAEAAVYAFEARLGGGLHPGPAPREETGAGGQGSFLLQQEGAGGDMFSCSLGNLPSGEEAVLTLRYVCELPLEPDGAARYVLPTVLRPRYTPHGETYRSPCPSHMPQSETHSPPHGPAPCPTVRPTTPLCGCDGVAHVGSTPCPPHLGAGPHLTAGSLMGDPAVMVTLLPSVPEVVPAQSRAGEFILLLDRSGSMACPMDSRDPFRQRINSAKETLIPLLKSLPLGCYFNICDFGSEFKQSMEYTQQTMAESLQRIQLLQANLWGTKILEPLRAIYRSPCRDGHPHQVPGALGPAVGASWGRLGEWLWGRGVMLGVSENIGDGVSTPLIKGIARAAGGSAEFITGQDRMQPHSPRRWTGVSLSWDLPPGMQAQLLHRGPEVIFAGSGASSTPSLWTAPGERVRPLPGTPQAGIQVSRADPMTLSPRHRLPVHQLTAKSLELEGAVGAESEVAQHQAREASLSSGVICSLTTYVGVDTEQGQPVQGPLVIQDVPLAGNPQRGRGSWRVDFSSLPLLLCVYLCVRLCVSLSICSLNLDFIKEYMEMIDCVSIREVSIDRIYERPASKVSLYEPNYRSVFGRLSHDLHTAREDHCHKCLQLSKCSTGHLLPQKCLPWLRAGWEEQHKARQSYNQGPLAP